MKPTDSPATPGEAGLKAAKAAYVRSQRNTTFDHHCHFPGCETKVPPAKWGCWPHWKLIPRRLQVKIWAAYRPGQEITKTPSAEYIAVANEVQDWIAGYLAPQRVFTDPLSSDTEEDSSKPSALGRMID